MHCFETKPWTCKVMLSLQGTSFLPRACNVHFLPFPLENIKQYVSFLSSCQWSVNSLKSYILVQVTAHSRVTIKVLHSVLLLIYFEDTSKWQNWWCTENSRTTKNNLSKTFFWFHVNGPGFIFTSGKPFNVNSLLVTVARNSTSREKHFARYLHYIIYHI